MIYVFRNDIGIKGKENSYALSANSKFRHLLSAKVETVVIPAYSVLNLIEREKFVCQKFVTTLQEVGSLAHPCGEGIFIANNRLYEGGLRSLYQDRGTHRLDKSLLNKGCIGGVNKVFGKINVVVIPNFRNGQSVHHHIDKTESAMQTDLGFYLYHQGNVSVAFYVTFVSLVIGVERYGVGIKGQVKTDILSAHNHLCQKVSAKAETFTAPTFSALNFVIGKQTVFECAVITLEFFACLYNSTHMRTVITICVYHPLSLFNGRFFRSRLRGLFLNGRRFFNGFLFFVVVVIFFLNVGGILQNFVVGKYALLNLDKALFNHSLKGHIVPKLRIGKIDVFLFLGNIVVCHKHIYQTQSAVKTYVGFNLYHARHLLVLFNRAFIPLVIGGEGQIFGIEGEIEIDTLSAHGGFCQKFTAKTETVLFPRISAFYLVIGKEAVFNFFEINLKFCFRLNKVCV